MINSDDETDEVLRVNSVNIGGFSCERAWSPLMKMIAVMVLYCTVSKDKGHTDGAAGSIP